MAIPVLPSQFKPIFGSYSHGAAGGVSRTDIAGGSPRYALQFDRGFQKWNVTLNISATAYTYWTTFFHHVIKKGAITFRMNLDSGFGLEPHDVNIVPDTYSAAFNDFGRYVISFVCEGESTVYELSDEEVTSIMMIYETYGDGLTDDAVSGILISLARFATVDSLVLNF